MAHGFSFRTSPFQFLLPRRPFFRHHLFGQRVVAGLIDLQQQAGIFRLGARQVAVELVTLVGKILNLGRSFSHIGRQLIKLRLERFKLGRIDRRRSGCLIAGRFQLTGHFVQTPLQFNFCIRGAGLCHWKVGGRGDHRREAVCRLTLKL